VANGYATHGIGVTSRRERAQQGQQPLRTGPASWVVALAAVLGGVGALAAVAVLALSLAGNADQRTCRTIAWAALPAGANLPSGWTIGSNRVFVNNLTTTLVGPEPSDSTQRAAAYVSVSCHGSDVQLALRRTHEAELAAGSIDEPLPTIGDESFAVRSAGAGSVTIFLRRGALLADVTAATTLDQSVFLGITQTIDDALVRVLAAGPDGPAVAQPPRPAPTAGQPAPSAGQPAPSAGQPAPSAAQPVPPAVQSPAASPSGP
jgi:hypothetical protein